MEQNCGNEKRRPKPSFPVAVLDFTPLPYCEDIKINSSFAIKGATGFGPQSYPRKSLIGF